MVLVAAVSKDGGFLPRLVHIQGLCLIVVEDSRRIQVCKENFQGGFKFTTSTKFLRFEFFLLCCAIFDLL